MNLKEKAEELGITLTEAKELTGLTHWNQTVPESCDEIPEIPEYVIIQDEKLVTIETESKQDLTEAEQFSIFILGNKSPYWKK